MRGTHPTDLPTHQNLEVGCVPRTKTTGDNLRSSITLQGFNLIEASAGTGKTSICPYCSQA
ncbi:MAG: hypothetical protein HFP77_10185 [Methylococcales symbiont of Iophon sp. n. MRB-2018]|nr:MAG: hypothetical protein HFP77_10185 [Methylococcales symbiont of Iophon sp. n. MRB-2018]